MGKSALQTSKEFDSLITEFSQIDQRFKAEQEARLASSGKELNIAKLYMEEEKKEAEYRR